MLKGVYEERMAVPQGKKEMKQEQKCNETVRLRLPKTRRNRGDMGDCRPLWEAGQNARDAGFKRRWKG